MPSGPPPTPDRIVVAAVCLRDDAGRVLAVRKRGTTRFMQPGGKLEPGETPAQAAVREVREEIGLDVEVRLLGEFTTEAANEPGAVLESTVFTAELTGTPVAAGEIEELRWVAPDATDADLAPLLRDHVLPALVARVEVVGMGADGVPPAHRALVEDAEVLLGGARQLALVPSVGGQVRRSWPSPLRARLAALLAEHAGRRVVALASGDPLVSGIATTLLDLLGPTAVTVHPAVSSLALARARMGWPAESAAVVTVVGRDPHAVLRELAPGRRVLVLSSDEHTPVAVARLLTDAGYGASRLTVLGDLGSPAETRATGTAATWDLAAPRLHVLALELSGTGGSWASGLPDDAYEHDGQLTRRDLRAAALARLQPRPGELLWDVGAGAGSVGIEWMRAHPSCRTLAVEADPDRAARVGRNAARLGVPALAVVGGRAPAALSGLPRPHAVFVGGGATAPGLLEVAIERLRPGGRLVVHGVTLETERLLGERYAVLGGELVRLSVEQAAPLGTFTGWTPARAVTQWSWTKETSEP